MKTPVKLLWAALGASTLIAMAPDLWLRSASADAPGRFCAAPLHGDAYCVSADRSPADAWSQAAAHGRLPIEMWAEWPSHVTLDELARNTDRLNAWFADVDKVLAYVRDTQRNAESYKATLAHVHVLMDQVKARQDELRNRR